MYTIIKGFAKKRNVSIRKVEMDLGFANGTINKWEDSGSISLKKVKAVAEYLHVDPYTLLLAGVDMDKITDKE